MEPCKSIPVSWKKTYLLALIALALFVAAYLPGLKVLVGLWASSDDYQHAFLFFPIAVFMVWQKRSRLSAMPARSSGAGLFLVILGAAGYFFAALTQVNTLIFLSMYCTLVGAVIHVLGLNAMKELYTPFFLFLVLIPIPQQLYIKVTFPLQLIVSQVTEVIVRLAGIPILLEGNIINIPQRRFEVAEACSGLRSMATLIALSIVIGYFLLNKLYTKAILVIAGIPTAIFANIIRVTSMVLLFHFFRIDLTHGTLHTILGLVVYSVALVTLLFLQKLLASWEKN